MQVDRFERRQLPNGKWDVIDSLSGVLALMADVPMTGLSFTAAIDASDSLNASHNLEMAYSALAPSIGSNADDSARRYAQSLRRS